MDAPAPPEIVALAEARSAARGRRDWAEADRLRAEIEAAGWKVVDHGLRSSLSPAHAADLEVGGRTRYGRSAAVPSRLGEPAVGLATIVLVATDWAPDLLRAVGSLRTIAPEGAGVVIVGDGPSAEVEATLERLEASAPGAMPTEVVRTSERLGQAAAANAGVRRAAAPVVILMDTSVEAAGDFVTPVVRALDDPTVAVAGGWGIVSADLRHFTEAPPGDVDAIEAYCQAFRRADYLERGPLDERFRFYRNLDIWWSLVLRDEGEGRPPRRAISLDGLPLVRHEHRGYTSIPPDERDRLSRRNFYRVLDRFGARRDLLLAARRGRGPAVAGPGGGDSGG